MSPLKIGALAAAALLAPAAHDNAPKELARALAGLVPGRPVDCINSQWAEGPEIIDQNTILYRNGPTVYRNDLPSACRPMRTDSTVIVEIYGGQLCRLDRFRVREPGDVVPSETCLLGKFTPYTKPKR